MSGSLETTISIPSLAALAVQVQNNPDMARWVTEMAARRAQIDVAQSRAVPDLTVSGGMRYFNEVKKKAFLSLGSHSRCPSLIATKAGYRKPTRA